MRGCGEVPWHRSANSGRSSGFFVRFAMKNISIPTRCFLPAEPTSSASLGYEKELAKRIPNFECHVFPHVGHMLHIEFAERFNGLALAF